MNIFGLKVRIKYMPLIKTMGLCGFFDPEKKIIVIDSAMKDKDKMETLIHECFHALSNRLSWGQAIPKELEETMADQWAKMMVENFDIKLKK